MLQALFKSPNIGGLGGYVIMGLSAVCQTPPMSVSKEMVPQYLRSNQGVGCSSANYGVSSNSWGEKLFKPHFKSPNIGGAMRRSNEVGECSSANDDTTHLPLFLNNKRIFIVAMVSCSIHPWSLWIGLGLQTEANVRQYLDGNKELECVVYEQPNEVKEVEVRIEIYSLTLKEAEDKLSIETRIVYEDEGELCFFPINPIKKVFHQSTSCEYFGSEISYKPHHVKVTLTLGRS
nr:disease resistance protein TAO1-like [Ipomoea batatas]